MIRFAGALILALAGVVVALGFIKLTDTDEYNPAIAIALGIVGAFLGMWTADITDTQIGGNVVNSLIFSMAGAAVLLTLFYLFGKRRN